MINTRREEGKTKLREKGESEVFWTDLKAIEKEEEEEEEEEEGEEEM